MKPMPKQVKDKVGAETLPAHIRWHCRRGMLELDILLGNFFDQKYLSLKSDEQQAFVDLLACNDDELYTWLVKRKQPAAHLKNIVNKIV